MFGWGNGCSGYPFSTWYNQYVGDSWVVECDFINRLWNFGYIGFALWYGWYGYNVVKSAKIDKRYVVLFAALLRMGVTYNVMMGWCFMTLLLIFTFIAKKRNIFDELTLPSSKGITSGKDRF